MQTGMSERASMFRVNITHTRSVLSLHFSATLRGPFRPPWVLMWFCRTFRDAKNPPGQQNVDLWTCQWYFCS